MHEPQGKEENVKKNEGQNNDICIIDAGSALYKLAVFIQ